MQFQLAGAGRCKITGADAFDLADFAINTHLEAVANGWWDDFPVRTSRLGITMGLIIEEFAEAISVARRRNFMSIMDSHLPERPAFQVEIADAFIRAADMYGAVGEDHTASLAACVEEIAQDFISDHCEAHPIVQLAKCCEAPAVVHSPGSCAYVIASCIAMARIHDFDLFTIAREKIAYNRVRPDHKPEARSAEGGKAL